MLEPIELSGTILTGPMSPRWPTWVPPHSSSECGPASSTRTTAPYLSPKKAMAPISLAWSLVVSKCRAGWLASTSALTRSSTWVISSGVRAP